MENSTVLEKHSENTAKYTNTLKTSHETYYFVCFVHGKKTSALWFTKNQSFRPGFGVKNVKASEFIRPKKKIFMSPVSNRKKI